jgi:hypothetical protein
VRTLLSLLSVLALGACLLALDACRWTEPLLVVHDASAQDAADDAGAPDVVHPTDALNVDADASASGEDAESACKGYQAVDAGGGLTAGLVAWYRCESASTTSAKLLPDSSPNGNDAMLVTGSGGSGGYSFVTGKIGKALRLTYTKKGYVSLPPGLMANACEATIATWVYINSNVNAWTRLWDFGQNTVRYMFLTPITNTDNVARFGISISGNLHEETIKTPSPIPTLKWAHVAFVIGPTGATLYLDGAPIGTNSIMKLRPADLGSTTSNFIGRSEFDTDPYLDADIDEFRIYDRALSAEEIRALASQN